MCEENDEELKDDERADLTVALYNQAMEELRHRRSLEWQTLIVVNIVYGFALKILHDFSGRLTFSESAMVIIAVTFFTYIWFVRIHINSWRMERYLGARERIHKKLRDNICRGPKREIGQKWPFYGHRGVLAVICLYYSVLVFGVIRKTNITKLGISWLLPVIFLLVVLVLAVLDVRAARHRDEGRSWTCQSKKSCQDIGKSA
jgi:protein-S-isoprenylcysteine O-methyltransferase Ste14